MRSKFNRAISALLAVMVLSVSLVTPAFADFSGGGRDSVISGSGRYVQLLLDNGTVATVPNAATTENFIVVKDRWQNSVGLWKTGYIIYDFEDYEAKNGEEAYFIRYYTDYFFTNSNALETTEWQSASYSEVVSINASSIVFSSFDFYDINGNLVYDSSVSDGSVSAPPALGGGSIGITLSGYDGKLPALPTGAQTYNNWLIVKNRYAGDRTGWDESHAPVWVDEPRSSYNLYFFSDDYEIVMETHNVGSDVCPHYIPVIRVEAAVVQQFTLGSDEWDELSAPNITDNVFNQTIGKTYWYHANTYNDAYTFAGWQYYNSWSGGVWSNKDLLTERLDEWLVASSAPVAIYADTTEWSYLTDPSGMHNSGQDESEGAVYFGTPSISWSEYRYVGFGGAVEDTSDNLVVYWLKKIYNAMVDGFNQVLNKIGLGGGGGGTVIDPENPEYSDGVQEGDGFSLIDIIKALWNAIKKILSGIWNVFFGAITDMLGAIGDFFGAFADPFSGGLFDFFDNDEASGFTDFFGFMRSLWGCIPTPVSLFILASFSFVMFFGLLKMFH